MSVRDWSNGMNALPITRLQNPGYSTEKLLACQHFVDKKSLSRCAH